MLGSVVEFDAGTAESSDGAGSGKRDGGALRMAASELENGNAVSRSSETGGQLDARF